MKQPTKTFGPANEPKQSDQSMKQNNQTNQQNQTDWIIPNNQPTNQPTKQLSNQNYHTNKAIQTTSLINQRNHLPIHKLVKHHPPSCDNR
jgi:hypothetical protein